MNFFTQVIGTQKSEIHMKHLLHHSLFPVQYLSVSYTLSPHPVFPPLYPYFTP